MKIIFSRILFLLSLVIVLVATSCDKLDDNGPFYGYWLLTEVDGPDGPIGQAPELGMPTINGDVIDVNTDRAITWAVRNELLMLHDCSTSCYYYFTFSRDASTLQLLESYYNDGSNDTRVEFDALPAEFHIPSDGHFDIITLDRKSMVLRAGVLTLRFKKN